MRSARIASCLAALASVFAISLGTNDVMAWTGLDVAPYPFWGSIPVKFYVNAGSFPTEIKATAQQRLVDGFGSWAAPDCTSFAATLVGDLPNGYYDMNDGKNVLLWVNKPNPWPGELGDVNSVIGVTLPIWASDSKGNQLISDADIVFNNVGFCWFDSMAGGSTCVGGSPVDTQSIATHEQGHFLGLGHTDATGATMEPFYDGGNAIASIEQDDIDGVCTLYPVGGNVGVSCDPCRQGAANNECLAQTKACTGPCLGMYNCVEACPTSDQASYDACKSACSTQFPAGATTYMNYANCVCNVCASQCGVECGGNIGGGTGGAGGAQPSTGSWNSDDPGPVIEDKGGCGCAVYGTEGRFGALFAAGAALFAALRKRRRA